MERPTQLITYLITDDRLFKIGKTSNMASRMLSHKTSNAFVRVICQGDGISEGMLHALYNEKRVSGEWFDLSPEDESRITSLILGEYITEEEFHRAARYLFKSFRSDTYANTLTRIAEVIQTEPELLDHHHGEALRSYWKDRRDETESRRQEINHSIDQDLFDLVIQGQDPVIPGNLMAYILNTPRIRIAPHEPEPIYFGPDLSSVIWEWIPPEQN
jgi:hypothetical protein